MGELVVVKGKGRGGITSSEGLRDSAEESLGRERMRLQTEFQVLLTQAAEAKDGA